MNAFWVKQHIFEEQNSLCLKMKIPETSGKKLSAKSTVTCLTLKVVAADWAQERLLATTIHIWKNEDFLKENACLQICEIV